MDTYLGESWTLRIQAIVRYGIVLVRWILAIGIWFLALPVLYETAMLTTPWNDSLRWMQEFAGWLGFAVLVGFGGQVAGIRIARRKPKRAVKNEEPSPNKVPPVEPFWFMVKDVSKSR